MADNFLDLPLSETEIDIPLILKIGALLRHLGYPVRSKKIGYETYEPEKYWDFDLIDGEVLQIGKVKSRKIDQPNSLLRLLLGTKHNESVEFYTRPVASIQLENDQIILLCDHTDNIQDLRVIGDILQQAFGKKTIVKLIRVRGVPSAQSLRSLPISAAVLTITGVDLVNLLGQRVNERFSNEMQLVHLTNGSAETKIQEGKNVLLEIVLISDQSDPDTIDILCTVYRQDVVKVVQEEIAGLVETVQSKKKILSYKIEQRF